MYERPPLLITAAAAGVAVMIGCATTCCIATIAGAIAGLAVKFILGG